MGKTPTRKTVETHTHEDATRKKITTTEYQPVLLKEQHAPVSVAFDRGVAGLDVEKQCCNRDLGPQLVWRGEDEQDWYGVGSRCNQAFDKKSDSGITSPYVNISQLI